MDNSELVEKDIEFWLRVRRESRIHGASFIDDAAKQIVGTTSILQGLYFAVISLSDVKKVGTINDLWFVIFVVFSFLTILLWFLSLFFAVRTFLPKEYGIKNDTSMPKDFDLAKDMAEAYITVLKYKQKHLKISSFFLWLSFVPLAVNMIVYLIYSPVPLP